MHTLIPITGGFLVGGATKLVEWDGTTATDLADAAAYSNPIQHAYHSEKVLLVNGTMDPAEYSGGTLTSLNFTSGITTESELIGVTVFKSRAFYWKDEAGFYYANAGSYQGDLGYFDVSSYADGNVKFCFTYSTDAGDGTDDMFVVVTDKGQALMYQGNDPSDVENWELIAKYRMPPPLGIRGHCDFAGDQVILTERGWMNFDHIVKNGTLPGGIGHKIVELVREAVEGGESTHLWEAHYLSAKGLIVITTLQSGSYIQHVMNTLTGAWCTFSGINSLCWAVRDGQGYWANNNKVFQYSGYNDSVVTDAVPAYTQLGSDGFQRQVTAIRPVTNIDPKTIGISAAADFDSPSIPSPSMDASDGKINGQWRSLNKFAHNLSYRMRTASAGYEKRWYSTQIMFKQGGPV
jgi:hypothetical protein